MPRIPIVGLACSTFLILLSSAAVPQGPARAGADAGSGQLIFNNACDTNTLADVVSPEASRQPTNPADAARVRAAIQLGKIQGFFSETLVSLEGVQTKDRAAVFGSTRLQSESTCTDENTITISIGVVQDRKPLDPKIL